MFYRFWIKGREDEYKCLKVSASYQMQYRQFRRAFGDYDWYSRIYTDCPCDVFVMRNDIPFCLISTVQEV